MNRPPNTRAFDPPVLVWTVGKVASSSINATLEKLGVPTLHVHYLSDWHVSAQLNQMYRGRTLPLHIVSSLRFRHSFDRDVFKLPIRIVTLVRDPLARNMSAYFENLAHYSAKTGVAKGAAAEDHAQNFIDNYQHDIVFDWFDDELHDVTGLDYRTLGFNPAKRYRIHRDAQFELLIMRAEDPDDVKLRALSEFIGQPITEMVRKNEAESKSYKEQYQAFKRALVLPEDHLDRMYNHPFCATFWTPAEIEQMRGGWAAGPARGSAAPAIREASLRTRLHTENERVPNAVRRVVGKERGSDVLFSVQAAWAVMLEGFDRQVRLRFSGELSGAVPSPKLALSLYAEDGTLLTTFAPRPNPGALQAGRFSFVLHIADLALAAGDYYGALTISGEDGAPIVRSMLPALRISGERDDARGVITPSFKWTQHGSAEETAVA